MEQSDSTMLSFSDTRTLDVHTSKTFDQLLIHPDIVQRIKSAGYAVPTPIQAGALPLGLMGNDLLVQAKSGTGKTLVFATLAAQIFTEVAPTGNPLAVLLAPTREIALQIKDTVSRVAPKGTRIVSCIGGTDYGDNRRAVNSGVDVLIGTPGRIAQLINDDQVKLNESRLFVLDEADKLCGETFLADIELIYKVLCPNTQVTVFSATYTAELSKSLCDLMHTPVLVRLNADDVQLVGIHQYALLASGQDPIDVVHNFLGDISYGQVIIFASAINQCQPIADKLESVGHRVKAFSSDLPQEQRTRVINDLKNYALRVMVSTDAAARGIDASNVNVVVNIGPPYDTDTYFHRIGRAGRYGGYGVGVTVLTSEWEVAKFKALAKRGNFHVKILDRNFPEDITTNTVYFDKQTDFVAPSDRPDAGDGNKGGVLRQNGNDVRKKSQVAMPGASDPVVSSKQAAENESRKPVSYDSQEATPNASQASYEPPKPSATDSNTKKSSIDIKTANESNEEFKAKTDEKPISAENKLFESNLQAATNGIQKIRIDSHADSATTDTTSALPSKISTLQGKTFGRSFAPATGLGKLFKPTGKPSILSTSAEKPSSTATTTETPSIQVVATEKPPITSVPPMVPDKLKEEPLVAAGMPPGTGIVKAVADSISSLKGKSFGKGFSSATTLGKLFTPAKKATSKPEPLVEDCSEAKEDVTKAPKTEPEVPPPTPKPLKVEFPVEPVKPVEVAVAVTRAVAPEVPVERSPVNPELSNSDPSVEPAKPVEVIGTGTIAPGVQVEKTSVNPEPSKPEPSAEPIRTDEPVAPFSTSSEAPLKPLTAYSRAQMHEIRDSRDSAAWEAYARNSPWDTATDPFQFDPELRCSVPEQLKVLQKREKLFYKQKLVELNEEKERQKANVAAIMAYASAAKEFASGIQPSGVIGVDEVKSVLPLASCKSWDEFVSRLDAFTAKSEEKRAKFVQGPMVFSWSTPEEFDEILDMIGPRLQKKTDQVVASIRAARSEVDAQTSQERPAVSTIEISTQTDYPPPVQPDPAVVPKANAREELTVEDSQETESESEYTYSTDTVDADFEADGREHVFQAYADLLVSKIKLC